MRGLQGSFLVAPTSLFRPQAATIVSKALRSKDYSRPIPYPYKTDRYGYIQSLLDKTTHRFDDNTKIIVVDGPIAAGKTDFAKEIADELDMMYMPEANLDMCYINPYGYDLRQLDDLLPERMRSYDLKDFLKNPTHPNANSFQFEMFTLRMSQYIDALAHVLNTGQGVVMDRSVYSDFVFVEAMTKFGYMTKAAREYYYECKKMGVPELMRPHLVIYLDMPVEVVQQRIQERNYPHEANSPVYTTEFLSYMDQIYKQQYLKEISVHAELLIYDWSEKGDPEVVIEDIERLEFKCEKHKPKLADWLLPDETSWCTKRMLYTLKKAWIMQWINVPTTSVPELLASADEMKKFNDVWNNAPGMKYAKGFNADAGDQFIALKIRGDP